MSTDPVHRGSCKCGSVKYEVTGNPWAFFVCHCINCKKLSGTAFMSNIFFKADQYKFLEGEDLTTIYTDTETTSGNPKLVSFCSKCGSPVRFHSAAKGISGAPSGTFDEPIPWTPTQEVFNHAKREWVGDITTKAI